MNGKNGIHAHACHGRSDEWVVKRQIPVIDRTGNHGKPGKFRKHLFESVEKIYNIGDNLYPRMVQVGERQGTYTEFYWEPCLLC